MVNGPKAMAMVVIDQAMNTVKKTRKIRTAMIIAVNEIILTTMVSMST